MAVIVDDDSSRDSEIISSGSKISLVVHDESSRINETERISSSMPLTPAISTDNENKPKQIKPKIKRSIEHQPSVITSKKWVEIQEAKEKAMQEKEQLKVDKTILAASKKISAEAKKLENKLQREKAKELKKLMKPKKNAKTKKLPIKQYSSSEESDIENIDIEDSYDE